MSLKDRLGRLGRGAPVSRREADLGEGTVPASASTEGKGTVTLESLRAKVEALLRQEPRATQPPEGARGGESDPLPFIDVENRDGFFSQRLFAQRPSAHVGRMPLSAAQDAGAEMLSLLALDPALASCDPKRALYFDTETTGLGGAGTVAFLSGFGWFDDDGCLILEQILLREPASERAMLARISELVERASFLVSFNGKSFDWPLLKARCVMNRFAELPSRPHLDLLHVARRLHKRRLQRFRLIALEADVLGWERPEDDIPGAEIPARYSHYLRTGDEEAIRAVVDHNAWDVLSMVALVGLYGEEAPQLSGEDLLGMTETLTRARAYDQAEVASNRASSAGHSSEALELRAKLNKARGDKARALVDFEALSREVDDPHVRLELAKLFEHYARDFERALAITAEGTGEDDVQLAKRKTRLERRVHQAKKRIGP